MVNGPGPGVIPPIQGDQSGIQRFQDQFNGVAVDGMASTGAVQEQLAQQGDALQQQNQGFLQGQAQMFAQREVARGGGQARWNQAGGLSLDFQLPTTGKKLVFSKVGGDPKLALAVRPQESIRWGLNLAWSAVWLAIGLAVILAVRSPSITKRLSREIPIAAAVLSGLGFFILPGALGGLAFVAFVTASVVVAWIHRDPADRLRNPGGAHAAV